MSDMSRVEATFAGYREAQILQQVQYEYMRLAFPSDTATLCSAIKIILIAYFLKKATSTLFQDKIGLQ
jgi:hypothetical protein